MRYHVESNAIVLYEVSSLQPSIKYTIYS